MEAVFIAARRYADRMATERISDVQNRLNMETTASEFLHARYARRTDCRRWSTRNSQGITFNSVRQIENYPFFIIFLNVSIYDLILIWMLTQATRSTRGFNTTLDARAIKNRRCHGVLYWACWRGRWNLRMYWRIDVKHTNINQQENCTALLSFRYIAQLHGQSFQC